VNDLIVPLPVARPADPPSPAPPRSGLGEAGLGQLLGVLASRPGPVPKYRYPSAGTLYPVQTYVVLRQSVGALAAGSYYYDPQAHALVPLSSAIPVAPDSSEPAVLLLLVAQFAAIEPIYGSEAEAFCLIEAGYMSEALREAAPALSLRDAGDPGAAAFAAALALDPDHRPLVCWAVETAI
jgi:SagB-type dehydrogenase family enzyme